MRALRPAFLGIFALAALACGGNAPLTSDRGGAAGATATGAAGTPSTGQAGATATGAAGATAAGQAGAGGQSGPGITMCGSATLAGGRCAMNAYKHVGDVKSACVCQEDLPCVCGDTCTNLLLDVDNCGVCGNRCGPTSACFDGTCGPAPTIVVPAQSGCTSIDVAVSGNALYWTNAGHGTVQSMPIGGGGKTTYATGEAAPARLAVVGSSVFWLDKATAVRKGGATLAATTIVEAAAPVGGFVVSPDGATVYFSSDTMIYSVPATGGVPVVVAREEHGGQPGGLALAGNTLAFPTGLNDDVDRVTLVDGQVVSCGLGDAEGNLIQINCARLARGQGDLFLDTILARPDQVIWFDGAGLNIETSADAGNYYMLAIANDAGTGLAMNATTVYFSAGAPNAPGAGVIYKAPIAAQQTAVPIARGQDGPRSLAVGATKVYWSTSDCSIESTGL